MMIPIYTFYIQKMVGHIEDMKKRFDMSHCSDTPTCLSKNGQNKTKN